MSEGTKEKQKYETKRIYELKLSELDVKIMLEALGQHQIDQENRRHDTQATRILIDRVYRAIGVRL